MVISIYTIGDDEEIGEDHLGVLMAINAVTFPAPLSPIRDLHQFASWLGAPHANRDEASVCSRSLIPIKQLLVTPLEKKLRSCGSYKMDDGSHLHMADKLMQCTSPVWNYKGNSACLN
jgi:hypothetical protein